MLPALISTLSSKIVQCAARAFSQKKKKRKKNATFKAWILRRLTRQKKENLESNLFSNDLKRISNNNSIFILCQVEEKKPKT